MQPSDDLGWVTSDCMMLGMSASRDLGGLIGSLSGTVADAEPQLIADPSLASVLVELSAGERRLQQLEPGTSRADLDAMIAEDFREIGASGRRYDRSSALNVVERRQRVGDGWEMSDAHCREVAPDVHLLTYTLNQEGRVTHRVTVWKKVNERWTALYHQATLTDA